MKIKQNVGPKVMREFALELDQKIGQEIFRRTEILSLTRDPDQNDGKPIHWAVRLKSPGLSLNWGGSEAAARADFARELRRLMLLERSAIASGMFAKGKFLVGSTKGDA